MKLLLNIFLATTLLGCSNMQEGRLNNRLTPAFPLLSIRNAMYPLSLKDLDFHDTKNIEVFNDGITAKIEETISNIYYNDCSGDSSQIYFSIDDTYVGTLRLRDSLYSIFMVIFQHIPGGLDSKVLFYDMATKEFVDNILDFNIQGLYHLDSLTLKPTNLKERFNITTPEIELVDFDNDGVSDYKFTRLYHNGTANAIETTVIKVSDSKVDTLECNQKWIVQGADHR